MSEKINRLISDKAKIVKNTSVLQDFHIDLISRLQSYKIKNNNEGSGACDEVLEIHDPILVDFIQKSYFDIDKNKILSVCNTPMTREDQIKKAKIPRSSGYRKHKKLLNDGFLMVIGRNQQYKFNSLYVRYFSKVVFLMEDSKTTIQVKINDISTQRKSEMESHIY